MEFSQVPTWNLTYHIVQSRFEESRSSLCHRVLQVEESVAESQFGSHECQRISGCLRGQGRGTGKTGIYFDDAIIFRFGVESILYITFADNTDVADDTNSQFTKFMIFTVGQCLRRSNNDRLTGMNTQRVKVLHITNCNTVVETVADDFVFDFFPPPKRFFHQHLRRKRKGFFYQYIQLLFIVTETGAQATQRISRTDNDRISQFLRCTTGIFRIFYSFTFNGLDIDFVQFLYKEFTVFRIHNGLYGSTEYFYIILFKDSFFI